MKCEAEATFYGPTDSYTVECSNEEINHEFHTYHVGWIASRGHD